MNRFDAQMIAKTMEQGGAAGGASLGTYALIVEHKDLIITICTAGSFMVAFLGLILSTGINWYYRHKEYKLHKKQVIK